jgi:hypothetical protein
LDHSFSNQAMLLDSWRFFTNVHYWLGCRNPFKTTEWSLNMINTFGENVWTQKYVYSYSV